MIWANNINTVVNIRLEVFHKKVVLNNFPRFGRNYQHHSLFVNEVAGLRLEASVFPWILCNNYQELLYRRPANDYFWDCTTERPQENLFPATKKIQPVQE